jgi:hypothetical protein
MDTSREKGLALRADSYININKEYCDAVAVSSRGVATFMWSRAQDAMSDLARRVTVVTKTAAAPAV